MKLSLLLYRYIRPSLVILLLLMGLRGAVALSADSLAWRSVGVYDSWEHSPFLTGQLQGNVRVEQGVIAFQRSRYGSNTYGLRLDLSNTFELTPQPKYIHVRLLKPKAGRTMLIGLGKRRERAGQSDRTEQFWVYSTHTVEPGQWTDAVFPVKGAGGIDIHSLVVVPDCESTHNLASDFMAYVGTIAINDSPLSATLSSNYPLGFSPEDATVAASEGVDSVSIVGRADEGAVVRAPKVDSDRRPRYANLLEHALEAVPGERIVFAINGQPAGKSSVSVDLDNDGRFSATECFDGTVDLPASIPYGCYRLRLERGLAVVDTRLNVHPQRVTINQEGRNGEVVAADGRALAALSVPFGKPFTVRVVPSHGFTFSGVRIRYGYKLNADRLLHGTPQYVEQVIPRSAFKSNGVGTIPAELVRGDIVVEGIFVSK
ncbi:MAG: hypothetical protein SPG93_08860 [Prevotella sp.]|nr:hypothetical protein [Prevotella sp.]